MPDPTPPAEEFPFLAETVIRETRLARWEHRIERAIRTVMGEIEAQVLADLRRATSGALSAALAEVTPGPWEQLLVAELSLAAEANSTEIVAAMKMPATFDFLVAFGGYDFEEQDARLVARVTDMTGDVASLVSKELQLATAGGEGFDAMRDRVRDVFASTDVRARRIARTEVISAANGAQNGYAGAVASAGEQMTKTWLATFDRRTRPSHADAHGQTVAFDQPFIVGGADLDYPGDPAGPAEEVVNCRCTTTYEVVEGGSLEE